jgi:hypothetical protein
MPRATDNEFLWCDLANRPRVRGETYAQLDQAHATTCCQLWHSRSMRDGYLVFHCHYCYTAVSMRSKYAVCIVSDKLHASPQSANGRHQADAPDSTVGSQEFMLLEAYQLWHEKLRVEVPMIAAPGPYCRPWRGNENISAAFSLYISRRMLRLSNSRRQCIAAA